MYEEFLTEIETTSKALLQSISGLSEAQLKYKINAQVWSIHECIEHIVITEIAVYRILMQPSPADQPPLTVEKVGRKKIAESLNDRSRKTEALDDVKPVGRFSSMEELLDKFNSNRQRIIDGLKSNSIVFDSRIIVHPALGELTKKEWLHFMIHHCERHCEQVKEIRTVVQLQMI